MTDDEIALAHKAMTALALELPGAVYDDAIEKIIRPTFSTLQSELAAARGKACSLWMLLDDIDTAEDMAKSDDAAFRTIAHFKHRKRFEIMSGEEIDALSPISQATEKT